VCERLRRRRSDAAVGVAAAAARRTGGRTVKAEEADGQRRIGPQDGEEDGHGEDAGGDPRDRVAKVANFRLERRQRGVDRGHRTPVRNRESGAARVSRAERK
jgi:hypothetical protein